MGIFNQIIPTAAAILTATLLPTVAISQTIFSWQTEGFSEGAEISGFFAGEDLNQDGTISLLQGEIVDFGAAFSGDSTIDPFTINVGNLIRPPSFQSYVYGADLYDTSDDIFFGGANPGFFVGQGRYIEFSVANEYQNNSFSTVITQFDNPDFLGPPTGIASTDNPTQFISIVRVSESNPTIALLLLSFLGVFFCSQRSI